jgi:DNA-directed RNA polymerase specialized sigma subunit
VLWSVAANALVSSRARENSSSAEHTTAQFVRYRDDLEQVATIGLIRAKNDGDEEPRSASIAQNEPGYDQAETAADLERLLASLSERERTILRLRFEEDLRAAITTCSDQPAAR